MRNVEAYDWNREGSEQIRSSRFRLLDTTLRDGIQMPDIKQPTLAEKLKIIDFDARLGIEAIDICLPGDPKTRYFREGVECAKYIKEKYPNIEIVVLTPTRQQEVDSTLKFAEEAGIKLSSVLFRGSSEYRLIAEDWNEEEIVEGTYKYARELSQNGHKVICATEDSTRTNPEFLASIFKAGKLGGATEFCIADTVGYADPAGVAAQIRWLREKIAKEDGLQIQFHGHDDTRQAVSNSVSAIQAGADTVHVTWLGVGERAGNTSIEGILSDLVRRGANKYDLSCVVEAARLVSSSFNVPIAKNHPLVGDVVFTTSSGIHAAAIDKALEHGLDDVANLVYSPVDPRLVEREYEPAIGPLSGVHNVMWYCRKYGLDFTKDNAKALLSFARAKNSELSHQEIIGVIQELENSKNND